MFQMSNPVRIKERFFDSCCHHFFLHSGTPSNRAFDNAHVSLMRFVFLHFDQLLPTISLFS